MTRIVDQAEVYYTTGGESLGPRGTRGSYHRTELAAVPESIAAAFPERTRVFYVAAGRKNSVRVLRNVVHVAKKRIAPNNVADLVVHLNGHAVKFYAGGNLYPDPRAAAMYAGHLLLKPSDDCNVVVAISPAMVNSFESQLLSYIKPLLDSDATARRLRRKERRALHGR